MLEYLIKTKLRIYIFLKVAQPSLHRTHTRTVYASDFQALYAYSMSTVRIHCERLSGTVRLLQEHSEYAYIASDFQALYAYSRSIVRTLCERLSGTVRLLQEHSEYAYIASDFQALYAYFRSTVSMHTLRATFRHCTPTLGAQ